MGLAWRLSTRRRIRLVRWVRLKSGSLTRLPSWARLPPLPLLSMSTLPEVMSIYLARWRLLAPLCTWVAGKE